MLQHTINIATYNNVTYIQLTLQHTINVTYIQLTLHHTINVTYIQLTLQHTVNVGQRFVSDECTAELESVAVPGSFLCVCACMKHG